MKDIENKLEIIEKAIENKLGYDIEIIDIKERSSFADYFVIAGAANVNQLNSIADNVLYEMEKAGYSLENPMSKKSSEWLLLDFGDIIVHIFEVTARKYYDLERLWKETEE
ncbi:ribosome silencing factor [uncultured Ezakiella sp.]|uniref:ribosome silencing factor n=1 Tax=uncultured Ezakiella sp. TaxID=1637529 RepID=UPI0025D34F33|nr:ribosome silencing factor [uncultured Ezakiella sp.]